MGNSKSTEVVADESQHKYEAPKPTDSRAPCPGLNTLANHGYISRDGKNIRPEDLQRALQTLKNAAQEHEKQQAIKDGDA
ncbi:unnamed protein product [Adineta steineri]|uniref:Heme haloperoxidase family profile domain-containing protein n=1 Tax=Adineta steineri TaxID=433720 RepID=A0A819KY29_9BILA|nr:unnamed protein product [Adineta steineri]